MKVIFLDVDGVLNCETTIQRTAQGFIGVDPEKVKLLKKIVKRTGAYIVLSSTWREEDYSLRSITKILEKAGMRIYDCTPIMPRQRRGVEVQAWLDEHPSVTRYVILDDIPEFYGDQLKWYIKTHFYDGTGLTDVHVEMAIELLNS